MGEFIRDNEKSGLDAQSRAKNPERKRVLFLPEWVNFDLERGVVDYAQEAGWQLFGLAHHGADLDTALAMTPDCDGMVTLIRHSKLAHHVKSCHKPIVDLADTMYALPVHRVLMDDREIGRMAARHLVEQGLRHLAFLQTFKSGQSNTRAQGFFEVAAECGHDCFDIDLVGARSGPDTVAKRLRELPRPLGVMAYHDCAAWMVVEGCARAGLEIPADIALIGVGNMDAICLPHEIGLTSVEDNQYRQGYQSAALLDRLMSGEQIPLDPVLVPPSHVVVRTSTNALVAPVKSLRLAIEFIRENFRDANVHVEQVVAASGMSRRRLYSAFDEHMGMGINEALTRMRLNEAKRLLVESDLKTYAVAVQSGFRNDEHLIRTFSRVLGTSPGAFREEAKSPQPVQASSGQ